MNPPSYTQDWIAARTTAKVFARGVEYAEYRYVRRLERSGDQVSARVEGSQYKPYAVRITMDGDEVTDAACTCPYDWGGWCKHIVAVLLEMLYQPDRVVAGATAEALIEGLSPAQQRALLLHLAHRYPRLIRTMETWIAGEGRITR